MKFQGKLLERRTRGEGRGKRSQQMRRKRKKRRREGRIERRKKKKAVICRNLLPTENLRYLVARKRRKRRTVTPRQRTLRRNFPSMPTFLNK